jgi:hypothetical protein
VLVPVLALLSLIGGFFRSFTLPANVYVVLVGGALTWLGLSSRLPKLATRRRLPAGTLWWLVPALFLAVVELINFMFRDGETYAHPTLSILMDPVLNQYPARSAVYFGWLTAFWGLVRR